MTARVIAALPRGPAEAAGRAGWETARDLVLLTKPRVTSLVVATAGAGLWLAGRRGDGAEIAVGPLRAALVLALVGGVVGAANALNCWVERDADARMERTRGRPLASGRLDARVGLLFGLALGAGSVAALAVTANPLCAGLSLAALVLYVGVYTPLKRVHAASLLVGAIPGALPPAIGWAAATGRLDAPAALLFAVLLLWQIPHFAAIGLLLREQYAAAGFRVLSVAWSARATWAVAAIASAALLPSGLALVDVLGLSGRAGATAGALGGALLLTSLAVRGALAPLDRRRARALLLGSLSYLPCVLGPLSLQAG